MEIDLDAIRAARLEASGHEQHTIKFKGKTFHLAEELPWDLAEGLALDDGPQIADGVKQLLGKEWKDFRKLGPSTADVVDLAVQASAKFGVKDLGESEASSGSSTDSSEPSRPTSTGTTTSTSAKRSGGKRGKRSGASGRS